MSILRFVQKKVVVFDGAMGTSLAFARRSDVRGPRSEIRCNEAYNIYEPDLVLGVHKSFIDAGCDVIETNAFNANRISLSEFGLQDKVIEINEKAVQIALDARGSNKVFISGNIGPTGKLPSMGQIGFDELHKAYVEQMEVLVSGGVDQLQIETCQDLLQAKIAVIAANDIFKRIGKRIPLIVTVTVDATGKMLLGTEMDAVIATLVPLGVDVIGLNCGVGPDGMESAARYLAAHSPLPILLMPNAGLPEIVGNEAIYDMGTSEFADKQSFYVKELGVEMVGGCCGTTPEHISVLADVIKGTSSKKRSPLYRPALASLFSAYKVRQEPRPLIIGERMNVSGSKRFREGILADDFDSASMMSAEQADRGAHAIDISVSYAGRDEASDMKEIVKRVARRSRLPISVDSTSAGVMEVALKMIPGRPILNSINLQGGGKKAGDILGLARRFGAAVIALTIDDEGMARTAAKKTEIAEKLIELSARYGIGEENIFIDPLTFTLAEPRAAKFGSGAETLISIERIKGEYPDVNISLGISNISYGFKRNARRVLNSVFLSEAIEKGLDAAIVHAGQIMPLSSIDEDMVSISLDLIWKRREDALERFVKFFEGKKMEAYDIPGNISPEGGARLCIIRGDKTKIGRYLTELIGSDTPKDILNAILLPAMAEVGELFDKGKIPLPFVLQSAEVMRVAAEQLAPYFKKGEQVKRGRVILATVKGDVHDIGKNLVDIVLSNNGFDVVNLGVRQPVENILTALNESGADVIGLSGLLAESALVMKDDLAEMFHRGVKTPVVCGGAAITKNFVEKELTGAYGQKVYYASDAFDGLRVIEKILHG